MNKKHPTICCTWAFIALAIAFTPPAGAQEAKDLPVRLYVLVGQSNMQGKGAVEGEGSNTLRHLIENGPRQEFQFLVDGDGAWRKRSVGAARA